MRLVVLESPYAGDVAANVEYARECVRDSLSRGEAPFASHLIYTQPGILDDTKPEERAQGMAAGFAWLASAEASVVYLDRGVTPGMMEGMDRARAAGLPIEYRYLPPPFTCRYCGAPSYVDPSDQEAPPDYCHPEDHGSYDPA